MKDLMHVLGSQKDYKELKELEYDKLAATMREYMDMKMIYALFVYNKIMKV